MNRTGVIYAHIDPRNGELRYIGKTIQQVHRRLKDHCQNARNGSPTHHHRWLRQLLAKGLKLEIEVLEICNSDTTLDDAERFHIAYWRFVGAELTNLTNGGDGGLAGRKPSDSTRYKLSIALQKHPVSTETRRKMSDAYKANREQRRISNSRAHGGKPFQDQNGVIYQTQAEAARALNLSQQCIWAVLSGKRSCTKGYAFAYLKPNLANTV